MKFSQFVAAVDKLLALYSGGGNLSKDALRETLKTMFDDVREQAVHDLAEAVRQRDEAMSRLHSYYLESGGGKRWKKGNNFR